MLFTENVVASVTLKAKSEREAYIIVALNEVLHTLGLISESDYSMLYGVMSDNDMFKLF